MANHNKSRANEEIDEQQLMSFMAGDTKMEAAKREFAEDSSTPDPKNNVKDKKIKSRMKGSYGELFLISHNMVKRGDKSIYIRSEYHERLSRIVQVIGEDQIPLYAYLDNILEHHFGMFEKAITDDFNEKYKPIF